MKFWCFPWFPANSFIQCICFLQRTNYIFFYCTSQWCVFNNSSLLGIKNCQFSTQSSKLYLIWKLSLFAKIYHLNSLPSDQNFGRRRLAKLRRFDRKIKKRFLTTYFFFFFSWEKKTDVKVHYENSWLWKRSVKQKFRSWNFGIKMWTQKDFVYI